MLPIKSFQCPNCGSPVHTDGTQREISCEYCGSTVIVPEELRTKPVATPLVPFETNYASKDPFVEEQVDGNIDQATKVAAGVTAGVAAFSVILPLILTCVILGFVGAVLFFVFSNVNRTVSTISAAVPTVSFKAIAPTAIPDTPLPTAIPTPFDTPVPYTQALLKDDFTDPSSGWSTTHDADYTLEYKDGKYHVAIQKQDGGQVLWLGDQYTNLSVEVDVQQTAGPSDSYLGVVCRPTDAGGYYSFEFNQEGVYGIYKYTNWNPEPLAEGTLDPNTLSATAANHIEGVCDGSTLTLLLNGQALLQARDSDYATGGVGLILTTGNSGDPGLDALFSNFLAKAP